MNILKTFEIFNKETIKFLANRVINIFLLESSQDNTKRIFVDNNKKNETQITVVNNPKVYNLLTSAMYKQKKRLQENENIKS